MKLKLFCVFLLSILLIFFTGCPFAPNVDDLDFGALIVNYPEWCFGEIDEAFPNDYWNYYCYGYSDWRDWKSSEGKMFSSLVDETLVPNGFDGKYRLLAINQFLYVYFNDRYMTYIELHNYYGDYTRENNNRISVKQQSENVFEYDATLRFEAAQQFYGKQTHVRLEKVLENQFTYKLEVDGILYVSETMTNYKADRGHAIFPKDIKGYYWLPTTGIAFDENEANRNLPCRNYTYFEVTGNSLSFPKKSDPLMYCFEGISLHAIDEESQTVSYKFLDAGKNGHCDYFEIKIDSFDDKAEEYKKYKGALTFYKIENGEPRVLYRYTTQWIDENTDFNENSVEFW